MYKFNSEEPVQDQNMAMTVNDGSGYEWTELNMTLVNIFFHLMANNFSNILNMINRNGSDEEKEFFQ